MGNRIRAVRISVKRYRRQRHGKGKESVPVSVLLTAKGPQELKAKIEELKEQDHPNFEIVATLGGTVTEGYNRAIRQARGRILVFTETDVVPLSRSWLRKLAAHVRDGEVVKCLEIHPSGLNFSGTACDAAIAKKIPLDENYPLSSDTEWQKRLIREGVRLRRIYDTGVIHLRRPASGKALRWAYRYGREWVRLHRAGDFEEFGSLVEQTKHQIAVGRARLRGIADELKAPAKRLTAARTSR